jgi:hypothetical protein
MKRMAARFKGKDGYESDGEQMREKRKWMLGRYVGHTAFTRPSKLNYRYVSPLYRLASQRSDIPPNTSVNR